MSKIDISGMNKPAVLAALFNYAYAGDWCAAFYYLSHLKGLTHAEAHARLLENPTAYMEIIQTAGSMNTCYRTKPSTKMRSSTKLGLLRLNQGRNAYMSIELAGVLLERTGPYIYNVLGYAIEADLSEDYLDPFFYDRDIGKGAAEKAIKHLKTMGKTIPPVN